VNGATIPRLVKVGTGFTYGIAGKSDGYLAWPKGTGLRLDTAKKALGTGGNYTIAMLVKLTVTAGYGKLIDYDNLLSDNGLYNNDGRLVPYDLEGLGDPPAPIEAGKWVNIVLTRTGGVAKGYVNGVRYFSLGDPEGMLALGSDEVLHFFMDDGNPDEETGGRVARLRIWRDPLTNYQATHLAR
jgi:hypothetical protein